jgi:aminoglycoside phosphotransferase (APT) family kinase protein
MAAPILTASRSQPRSAPLDPLPGSRRIDDRIFEGLPKSVQTGGVDVPSDPGFVKLLADLRVGPDALIGHGGEAWVFGVGTDLVVRVLHLNGRVEDIVRRQKLVDELNRVRPRFRLPEIVEIGQVDGRIYSIERRLPGRTLFDVLSSGHVRGRPRLIETYLDTVASLGDLHLEPRAGFGDLIADDPITAASWRGYLAERAAASLAKAGTDFRSIDARALADALPEPEAASFVHLDAYVGNVLTDGQDFTAVIDIGSTSVAGDRRLDPLSAIVYLGSPQITPMATEADVQTALSWARQAGMAQWVEPARRWLAAFWTFAVDDPNVLSWCRHVLLGSFQG